MITAIAPGKVVLWGEYAVLEGAPAAVLAVNRYARCTVKPARQASGGLAKTAETGTWRFSARGFPAPIAEFDRLPRTRPTEAAAMLPWHVLQATPHAELPPAHVDMHTEAFFQAGSKLGLGSSAALCVALQAAFAALAGRQPDIDLARAAHRAAQGGRGSGIDVAASFFGGCLRYQAGRAQPCPDALVDRCFVWVGKGARTTPRLRRFADYLAGGQTDALRALAECSENLFAHPTIDALPGYIRALKTLDKAARLGVYSEPHLAAERLAEAGQSVYKPCGAGGGDVGMAVARSPEQLLRFASAAQEAGFVILDLETAPHGLDLEIR